MGLFDKMKKGVSDAQAAAAFANTGAAEQAHGATAGKIGVSGMSANPAAFGGPSTTPLAADDPLLQPVEGIGLAEYAAVGKLAQQRGVTDQAGMNALAAELGHDPAAFDRASTEWIRRMGVSMVVGQQFRKHLGY